jgi:hypothetical protein
MKNLLYLLFLISVFSCTKDKFGPEWEGTKLGTSFRISTQSTTARGYDELRTGTYKLAWGAIDYGRNFGLPKGTVRQEHFEQNIGSISFNEDGSGRFTWTHSDTLTCSGEFTYSFVGKRGNIGYLTINFKPAIVKTYIKVDEGETPSRGFGYVNIGNGYWKYEGCMSAYSGKFRWAVGVIQSVE